MFKLKTVLFVAILISGFAAIRQRQGATLFDDIQTIPTIAETVILVLIIVLAHPLHLLAVSITIFLLWLMIRTSRRRY